METLPDSLLLVGSRSRCSRSPGSAIRPNGPETSQRAPSFAHDGDADRAGSGRSVFARPSCPAARSAARAGRS
eukprot:8882144-Alexandrium_andersonii.AAC.1